MAVPVDFGPGRGVPRRAGGPDPEGVARSLARRWGIESGWKRLREDIGFRRKFLGWGFVVALAGQLTLSLGWGEPPLGPPGFVALALAFLWLRSDDDVS